MTGQNMENALSNLVNCIDIFKVRCNNKITKSKKAESNDETRRKELLLIINNRIIFKYN
jgi:hypothetical protein